MHLGYGNNNLFDMLQCKNKAELVQNFNIFNYSTNLGNFLRLFKIQCKIRKTQKNGRETGSKIEVHGLQNFGNGKSRFEFDFGSLFQMEGLKPSNSTSCALDEKRGKKPGCTGKLNHGNKTFRALIESSRSD